MKKKVLPLLLAAALCLGMLPAQALAAEQSPPIEDVLLPAEETPPTEEISPAEDVTAGAVLLEETTGSGTWGNLTWTLNEAGTLTISGNGKMPSASVPWSASSVKTLIIETGVTSIDVRAFSSCKSLTSVTVPETVTSIGTGTFQNCTGLTSVTLPEGMTVIGESAFKGCSALPGVTFPNSLKIIWQEAFSGCSSLTSVTFPEGMTAIHDGAFNGCKGLASVTLPSSLTTIGSSAFSGCSSLTSVDIPEGVTTIFPHTFSSCSALASVTLPEGLTTIGMGAFSLCRSLTGVTIPKSVTAIGESAFSGCSGLTSVTVPEGVTSIGSGTFSGCSGLTSVTLPDGVKSIGNDAFSGCSNLSGITIPNSVTSISFNAFRGCSGLTSVTLPTGITTIGEKVFFGCSSLTGVTLPDSVTTIGSDAFSYCSSLASVTIPNSVTSIASNAFSSCSSLASVTIPISVTSIGSAAFWGCPELADIYYAGSFEQWKLLLAASSSFTPPETAKIHFGATGETAVTVTFDPRGGQLDSMYRNYITVMVGTPYGELPTPTRYESRFIGWFTAADGIEQVTAQTIVSEEDAGRTLYARWISLAWLKKMTYSFGNSNDSFGYSANYKIPYERYVSVFGNTPRANKLFENSEAWGGNCFGMSTTSAMFVQTGNDISVGAFQSGASRPRDLKVSDTNGTWNLTLTQFIETMQIAQNSERINRHYWNGCSLDDLCAQAKAFQESGENPPVVSIWGYVDGTFGGHTMLVYDLVEISPAESRLMVYDPNFPDEERYIRLDRSNGAYTGWYYCLNKQHDWGTRYPGAKIACVPYSDFYETWAGKPVPYALSDRAAALASEEEGSALLIFNSDNATIYDAGGNQVAAVENGQLKTNRADIFPMIETDVTQDGAVSGGEKTILFLPPDQYTLERETGSEQPFDAVMVHVGQSACVTTSGSSVTFAVDDGCKLNYAKANGDSGSEPGTYTITLESSLLEKPEASPDGFYTVSASGSLDGKGASAAQVEDKLYAENVPAGKIQVNGDPVSTQDLGDGAALDLSAVLNRGITAVLQNDGSVALSSSPSGVVHVYAASYDSDGRMTRLAAGTLQGSTIRFSKPVAEGARIFLLDGNFAPVSKNIVVTK